MRRSRRRGCDWCGLLAVGILWGSCIARRFTVVPGVARNGGEAPVAGGGGDVGGVKCLAGAITSFVTAEIAVLARPAARWLGSRAVTLSAVNRQVTGSSSIAGACESCCLPAGIRKHEDLCPVLARHTGCVRCGALRGSWSAVRFLVVQHISVAGSGALRQGAGRVKCLAGAVHVLRLRAGCMRGAVRRGGPGLHLRN